MNKKELIRKISIQKDIPYVESDNIVNDILDFIMKSLTNNNEVKLSGFGTFKVKIKRERKGRNPQTGEEIIIPEHRIIKFKPSKKLKEKINNRING